MSAETPVVWVDLTVPDAPIVRDFYAAVMGWKPEDVAMGGYADFNMTAPASGTPVAGICHARGRNADIPPAWIVYFQVDDLDASLAACRAGGGEVLGDVRGAGGYRYAIIRDPAGAVSAVGQASR